MKKNFFIFLLLISFFSYSQDTYNTYKIGFKAGVLSEMGKVSGGGFPVLNIDLSKQLTPGLSISGDLMFGWSEGEHKNSTYSNNYNYDVNFQAISANLVLNLLNIGDISRENRKLGLNIKAGLGFLAINGDGKDNGENLVIEQGLFSSKSVFIPTSLGLKYKVADNLQLITSYDLMLPIGPGLDGMERNVNRESKYDVGFQIMNLGVSYNFGKNKSSMEWINPLDVISTKVNVFEQEVTSLTIDSDGDGVADKFDQDNNTPVGVSVDGSGKALDVDSDGIPDYKDIDPFTAPGVSVDSNGRELDDDQDGVPNSMDEEPNSPAGCTVNFQGRQIVGKGAFLPTVYFDVSSSEVSYSNYQRLATVASVLKANPGYKLRVIGFADSDGSTDKNYKLGLQRANAVIESLVNTFGIDLDRMIADSQGENNLLANEEQKMSFNSNSDGVKGTKTFKSLNRRVQFIIE